MSDRDERLFVYGSLRDPAVQQSLFGRLVPSDPVLLRGYRLSTVAIDDPSVVALSGSAEHRILLPGTPDDAVEGFVLSLTAEELAAADAYEVAAYRRVAVTLSDGQAAYAYVASEGASG